MAAVTSCENTLFSNGGFQLSRNFSVRMHVNFTRVGKIQAMCGKSRVNVKVKPRLTFTFRRGLSYIASILFTRVKFTRQWKSTLRNKKECMLRTSVTFLILDAETHHRRMFWSRSVCDNIYWLEMTFSAFFHYTQVRVLQKTGLLFNGMYLFTECLQVSCETRPSRLFFLIQNWAFTPKNAPLNKRRS